jgi:hypothetical protein
MPLTLKRSLLLVANLMFVLGSLIVPAAASAADSKPLVLETTPLPINLLADPGKTVSADLRVKQNGTDTQRLKVSLMKFVAYGNEGKPRLIDRQPGDDYFDWAKFDKTQFDAAPNVWQTVHMTINVPKTAAFGYYYAVVFSRVGDDTRLTGSTNAIAGGSAVLVLLEANSPNAKRDLQLVSFTSAHHIYEFLPAHFDMALNNDGNVHVVPQGDVFISYGSKQLATLPVNAQLGNILPGSQRIYPIEWTDGFPHYEPVTEDGKVKLDKDGKQVMHLVWDWSQLLKFRMGRYTAHLFAVYDDGHHDAPIEAEVSFWVIPWRLLLALLAVIVLIGSGIFFGLRGVWRGAAQGARRLRGRR